MNRLVKIGKAAEILGVSIQTLRRWEVQGSLLPEKKSVGGTRYYSLKKLKELITISLLAMLESLAMIKKEI